MQSRMALAINGIFLGKIRWLDQLYAMVQLIRKRCTISTGTPHEEFSRNSFEYTMVFWPDKQVYLESIEV